jgi:hypothetical protein
MTARTRRRARRVAVAAYTTAGTLLVWTVAATGAWPVAGLVALVLTIVGALALRATRPRRRSAAAPGGIVTAAGVPDDELLAVADAVGAHRTARHSVEDREAPTTMMRIVP